MMKLAQNYVSIFLMFYEFVPSWNFSFKIKCTGSLRYFLFTFRLLDICVPLWCCCLWSQRSRCRNCWSLMNQHKDSLDPWHPSLLSLEMSSGFNHGRTKTAKAATASSLSPRVNRLASLPFNFKLCRIVINNWQIPPHKTNLSWQTILLCIVGGLAGDGSMSVVVGNRWQETGDTRQFFFFFFFLLTILDFFL